MTNDDPRGTAISELANALQVAVPAAASRNTWEPEGQAEGSEAEDGEEAVTGLSMVNVW